MINYSIVIDSEQKQLNFLILFHACLSHVRHLFKLQKHLKIFFYMIQTHALILIYIYNVNVEILIWSPHFVSHHRSSRLSLYRAVEFTTRRKRHFPYKNCLTVALRRQIPVRIQVIQLCWQWSVQCTLVQRRQAGQHWTDYWELVPQQHSLSDISLKPFLPRCDAPQLWKLHRRIIARALACTQHKYHQLVIGIKIWYPERFIEK